MIATYFWATVAISVVSYSVLNFDQVREFFAGRFQRRAEAGDAGGRLFTVEELAAFNGDQLYLAILGSVFDVTKGARHYEPGGGYHGFIGRDASKAFITGDFTEEGLTDDISTLTLSDLGALNDWLKFYHKDYEYKGKLIGKFYDEKGQNTAYLNEILEKIKVGELEKKSVKELEHKYPPCNIEWNQEKGSRVWCSKQSGGVKRSWVGYPRKFFQPGKKTFRCACVKTFDVSGDNRQGSFERYEGCKVDSESCYIKEK